MTLCRTQHVNGADGIRFNCLDWIVHVVRRWRRWRQVIDLINWKCMTNKRESQIILHMFHCLHPDIYLVKNPLNSHPIQKCLFRTTTDKVCVIVLSYKLKNLWRRTSQMNRQMQRWQRSYTYRPLLLIHGQTFHPSVSGTCQLLIPILCFSNSLSQISAMWETLWWCIMRHKTM